MTRIVKYPKNYFKDKNKKKREFISINTCFENSDAHHINETYVIYIPTALHEANYGHRIDKPSTMLKVNIAAFNYLNSDCYLHLVEDYTMKF